MTKIVLLFLIVGSGCEAAELSKWLSKNRDKDGCVSQSAIEVQKGNSCPETFVVPDVRPMIKGTLNGAKTEEKKTAGKNLCCFDWKTLGNR